MLLVLLEAAELGLVLLLDFDFVEDVLVELVNFGLISQPACGRARLASSRRISFCAVEFRLVSRGGFTNRFLADFLPFTT